MGMGTLFTMFITILEVIRTCTFTFDLYN